MAFDALDVKNRCVEWIRTFFKENGPDCNAIIGISGGKDSAVVAALCVEALGKDRVIGVLMPNGEQKDIDDAKLLVKHLDIKHFIINVEDSVNGILNQMKKSNIEITEQTIINLPPRIRMSTLYAISQSHNGRVANNCNLSEDWVGYSTRYGDSVGDFSPLSNLTVTEVKKIGRALNLPATLIDKVPNDGLSNQSDEEKLGFSYEVLDRYIREGIIEDVSIKNRIDQLNKTNEFKLKLMPSFNFE